MASMPIDENLNSQADNQGPNPRAVAAPGYKFLILHAIRGDTRKTILDHIYCYPTYRSGNIYAYHHLYAPITPELESFPFDAVIINYCFLAYRVLDEWDRQLSQKYSFLRDSEAIKIAVTQDEYTWSDVLDAWLSSIHTDVIFSVMENDLKVLFPRCSGRVPIRHALTGYCETSDLARLGKFVRPFSERPIDLGTRVRFMPPHIGRAGVLKGRAAESFRDAALAAGFVVDISTRPEDVFAGDDWFRFLGSCRFAFVTRSGASLNDPRGAIRKAVADYLRARPDASFEEVEAACFPGLDGHDFTAISPRLFEAAAAKAGLILLDDHYVDGLEPYRHYIPLKSDFSNLDEVFALMRRPNWETEAMIEAAYRHLVENERFSYGAFVDDVLGEVASRRPTPRFAAPEDFINLKRHYERLAATERLLMDAPPHWSQVSRWTVNRAQQHGHTASLAGLAAAKLRAAEGLRSVMAAEMACGGAIDPVVAALGVEAMNGLARDGRDLNAAAVMLGDAARSPGFDSPRFDWPYCEYVYDEG